MIARLRAAWVERRAEAAAPERPGWDSPQGTRELAVIVAQARTDEGAASTSAYAPRHAAEGVAAESLPRYVPRRDGSQQRVLGTYLLPAHYFAAELWRPFRSTP